MSRQKLNERIGAAAKAMCLSVCLLCSTVVYSQTAINCVTVDARDGEKEEYEVLWNDQTPGSIRVDGLIVPRTTPTRSYTLTKMGGNILEWCTKRINQPQATTLCYEVDRRDGSIVTRAFFSDATNRVVARGTCTNSSQRKF